MLDFIDFPDAPTRDSGGDDPDMKFCQRIFDYALITIYSIFAVVVYGAVVARLRAWRGRKQEGARA